MLSYLVAGALMALPSAAAPAVLAEPAPTGLTLTWESGTPSRFAVTWQESGSQRNRVELVRADGAPTGWADTIVEPDQPNRASYLAQSSDDDFRIRISAIDEFGAPLSEPASSPAFDTDAPPRPVLHTVVPRVDGTVLMAWRPGVQRDDTPNDPLDRPAEDPPRFIPIASVFTMREFEDLSGPVSETRFVVSPRRLPQVVGVKTAPNEWGWSATTVEIAGTRLTAVVPPTTTEGRPLRVDGRAFAVLRACDLGPCFTIERPDQGRLLQLQSRTGQTAGWQVVGTTRSTREGAFRFSVTSPGSRQYRVVAPIVTMPPATLPRGFSATAPAATRARPPVARPRVTRPPVTRPPVTRPPVTRTTPDPGDDGMGGSLPLSGPPAAGLAGTGALFVALGVLLCRLSRRRPD